MGSGFNPFEDFVEEEEDGMKKFISGEESEEKADIQSKEYKKIRREVEKGHKTADREVVERLTRERLAEVRLEIENA